MINRIKDKPRVMVCPLNWGLGHASRCIPVIRKLQQSGFDVTAAADGRSLALLKEECEDVSFITLSGFSPRFSLGNTLIFRIPVWLVSLAWHTYKEHRALQGLVADNKIDLVISDNRFGLFTRKARCVFITHQVMFKTPRFLRFMEAMLYRINRFFIQKFDECWIPDLPGTENLSGDLSHKYPLPKNACFIGLLSRFQRDKFSETVADKNILALLSGPEPQRSIFEGLILDWLKESNHSATIVRGTPSETAGARFPENIRQFNHMMTGELALNIRNAGFVICRSGYSTLMDLAVLGKKPVLLIPTPGQTEQEYLARRLSELGWFNYLAQDKFNPENINRKIRNFSGISLNCDENLLDGKISELLRVLKSYTNSQ